MKILTFSLLIISLIIFYSIHSYENVSEERIENLLTLVAGTSGVIFTVLGLWIAYVYPNAIVKVVKPSINDIFSQDDLKRIERLMLALSGSLLIIFCVIAFYIFELMAVGTAIYTENVDIIKPIELSVVLCIAYAQLLIFYFVLATNKNFLNDLYSKSNMEKINKKLNK